MRTFEDFAERSLEAESLEALGQLFLSALEKEGFENFAIAEVAAFKLKRMALSHFPNGFLAYYHEQNYDRIDPIITAGLRTARPFCWKDALPRTMSQKQKAFIAECRELGVHSGITMPFHGPGGRVDLVSVSQRRLKPTNRKRLSLIYAISAQVWQRSLTFEEGPAAAFPTGIELSPRELECLAWVREGVSYHDIADRLGISHRTVEFHMSNVLRKLDARDKTAAVVCAMRLGLL
jgi:LuxR family quorum-sensing system transcriptional regulator SolR